MYGFEFISARVTRSHVAAPLVVEHFRVSEYAEPGLNAGRIDAIADQFGLEGGNEALGGNVDLGAAPFNGVIQGEIGEVIAHMAFCGGRPTAADAVRVVKEFLDPQ